MNASNLFTADIAAVQGIGAVPTILEVVCQTTGMGFAAVARVTQDHWVACAVYDMIDFGIAPGGELGINTTICDEIRQSGRAVVIDHVAQDEAFKDHPTPALYGFQSYISMPIVLSDGRFFGTLCAVDPKPARLNTPTTIGMFKLFAELIAFHLDAHLQLAAIDAIMQRERRSAELREQFIAVLGHDLRNPLAAIDAGARLVLRTTKEPKTAELMKLVNASAHRMAGLINNVMDFARGRMGSGMTLNHDDEALEPGLIQVISELRTAHPDRVIHADFDLAHPVKADRARVQQLLSNLIANALTHGALDAPIQVRGKTAPDIFELSVHNKGEPIPPEAMTRLFEPFERGLVRSSAEGLGLGLYIASEIARAHGGQIEVTSSEIETVFTFRMTIDNKI